MKINLELIKENQSQKPSWTTNRLTSLLFMIYKYLDIILEYQNPWEAKLTKKNLEEPIWNKL